MEFNINPITDGDGQTYEDRYQGYLKIFEKIAKIPPNEPVYVNGTPWSWIPLLYHLNCETTNRYEAFDHCDFVRGALSSKVEMSHPSKFFGIDRTAIEVLCGFRPETADALWKCDMQWKPLRVRKYEDKNEFIVTTNGAYYRPEVQKYLQDLRAYKPNKKKVLLVPCAADKPYPAPMHRAILAMMPNDFYMANATGVLGIVPQALWPIMPWYDSGIPNQWRLFQTIKSYFEKYKHERIIFYGDFYSIAVYEALKSVNQLSRATFILPVVRYDDYENLMDQKWLTKLKHALTAYSPTFIQHPEDAKEEFTDEKSIRTS